MNLTKRNKMLIAIFGVGLIALVVDRTVLRPGGGPRSASADSAETYAVTQNLPFAGADVRAPGGAPRGTPLAERLAHLEPRDEIAPAAPRPSGRSANQGAGEGTPEPQDALALMRNPFLLPSSWLRGSDMVEAPTSDLVARFLRTHHLAGVVRNGRECHALVDEQFLAVGQVLDGFTLVALGDRSAVFERDGIRAVLELSNK